MWPSGSLSMRKIMRNKPKWFWLENEEGLGWWDLIVLDWTVTIGMFNGDPMPKDYKGPYYVQFHRSPDAYTVVTHKTGLSTLTTAKKQGLQMIYDELHRILKAVESVKPTCRN